MAPLQDLHDRYCSFIHRTADKIRLTKHTVITQLIAETLGTLLLIFYGDGSVAQKFLGSISIVVTGKACPAILNPAVAVSNTIIGALRWSLLPVYILLEFLGAYLGAGLVLAVYDKKIREYAEKNDGGQFLTNTTGGIFVANKGSSVEVAVIDQIVTTAILVFGIYAITEDRLVKKSPYAPPAVVGLVVFLAVGTYTANASSALNPARDFGPRLLLLSTYWGPEAFRIDDYYFWVPLIAPIIGAVIGAILYELLVGIHTDREIANAEEYEMEGLEGVSESESAY
ncbi:Aquaporin-3 [Sparganum proliferum]